MQAVSAAKGQAVAAAAGPRPMQRERSAASFFDPTDPDAKAAREEIAMETLDELLRWFEAGGEVGIYDATNSTDPGPNPNPSPITRWASTTRPTRPSGGARRCWRARQRRRSAPGTG